jgi:hypothetical protein
MLLSSRTRISAASGRMKKIVSHAESHLICYNEFKIQSSAHLVCNVPVPVQNTLNGRHAYTYNL